MSTPAPLVFKPPSMVGTICSILQDVQGVQITGEDDAIGHSSDAHPPDSYTDALPLGHTVFSIGADDNDDHYPSARCAINPIFSPLNFLPSNLIM